MYAIFHLKTFATYDFRNNKLYFKCVAFSKKFFFHFFFLSQVYYYLTYRETVL